MSEINRIANYIMAEVPGEPGRDEGAGECAVRLLAKYRAALTDIMNELGVPSEGYPAPVANACEIANLTLATPDAEKRGTGELESWVARCEEENGDNQKEVDNPRNDISTSKTRGSGTG